MATAKELWDVLHAVAPLASGMPETYHVIQQALDSGADDSIMEECIEELESVANFLRGVCLDPSIPLHAVDALRERFQRIDEVTERLALSSAVQSSTNTEKGSE